MRGTLGEGPLYLIFQPTGMHVPYLTNIDLPLLPLPPQTQSNHLVKPMCKVTKEGHECLVKAYPFKLTIGHQKDPSHKRAIVVFRVEVWCSDMEWICLRVGVVESWVGWQQVNIVHGDVVTLSTALLKANVNQRGAVKPGKGHSDNSNPLF